MKDAQKQTLKKREKTAEKGECEAEYRRRRREESKKWYKSR